MTDYDLNPLRPIPIQSARGYWSSVYGCMQCSDTGAVLAKRIGRVGEAPWAFHCTCHHGNRRQGFPAWATADKHVFELSKVAS